MDSCTCRLVFTTMLVAGLTGVVQKCAMDRPLTPQPMACTACGLLVPLCAKFTEGYDTADLKDAKALLKELNA